MANFIYLDTTVNSEAATQSDSMATAKVVDDDEALMNMSLSSLFTSSETSKLGLDPSIPGLESHLGQIITKRHEVSSPPLAPSPFLG